MTRELIVGPEAELEITEAASRYETYSPGLGAEFIRGVEAAPGTIRRNPYQYQVIFREARRALLRRFFYALMYVVSEKEIIVVACIHGRRNPKHWQTRIP